MNSESRKQGDSVGGGPSRRLLLAAGGLVSRLEGSLPTGSGRGSGRRMLVATGVVAVLLSVAAVATVSTAAAALWTAAALGTLAAAAGAGLYHELHRSQQRLEATESRLETLRRELEATDTDRETLEGAFDEYRERVESSAGLVSSHLEAAADGDYTRRLEPELPGGTPDVLEAVAASFDALMTDLDETLFNVDSFAETVDATSIEAVETAEAVASRQETIDRALERLSDRTATQQRRLERANEALAPLSETVDGIAESTEKTEADLETTVESAESVQSAAEAALDDLEAATAAARTVRDRSSRIEAGASELGDRIAALGELSERTGTVALNATLQAARIESGQAPAPGRLRSLAGEAVAVADATDVRLTACNELLKDIEATNEGIEAAAETADGRICDAADAVEAGHEAAAAALEATGSAADCVRTIRQDASGGATATDHAVDLVDRVVSNRRSAEPTETLQAETAALGAAVESLDDKLGTVRTQTGFLQLQTDAVETSDVESVRSQRTAVVDD